MVITYAQKDILAFHVMIVINMENSGQINTLIQHNIVARDVTWLRDQVFIVYHFSLCMFALELLLILLIRRNLNLT